MLLQLNDNEDNFTWNLTSLGIFMTRSLYLDLLNGHIVYLRKYIWKIKVPLKIRIFMLFLHRKEIPT
jgi:hypothetical protein